MFAVEKLRSAHKPGRHWKTIQIIISYSVAAACLYWVFRDVHLHELFSSLATVNWRWLPAAIIFVLLVYVIAGWEWQILLRPIARLRVLQTTQAVFAGRFANDVLPVHAGYAIRVYLISRWTGAPFVFVIPSLMIERLFDGFWLALGIGVVAFFFRLPERISRVAEIWAAIIVLGLIAAVIFAFRGQKHGPLHSAGKWSGKLQKALWQAVRQLRAIGASWIGLAAFALSLLKVATQALAFLCLLWAYRFDLPLPAQFAVFLIAYVGLSIPSTPASVGVFQLFGSAGLELFHVPKADAAAFSLLAFFVLTAPLTLAGFVAVAQSGLSLRRVRHQVSSWKEARNMG